MGLTKLKEIFKNIKRSKSSFVSITMFVLLGSAIFQGFDYTGYAVKESMDKAFKEQNAYDILIPYTLGISEEEINQFRSFDRLTNVEGYFTGYEYFEINGDKHAVCISSLTNGINDAKLLEGEMPSANNEIVLLKNSASTLGIEIGDKLNFQDGNGFSNYLISQLRDIKTREDIENIPNDITTNFIDNEFTVTGFIDHPNYFANGVSSLGTYPGSAIQVELIGFVNYSAFNPLITNGYYSSLVLRSDELNNIKCYSDEYEPRVRDIIVEIEDLAQNIAYERFITCDANITEVLGYEDIVNKVAHSLEQIGAITQEQFEDYYEIKNQIKDYSNDLYKVANVSILTRRQNAIFFFGLMTSDIILKIKYSLGGIFIIVALLICLSSIGRLVGDDIKYIGVKKSLGFTKKEIFFTYLGYTLLASLIGLALGNGLAILIEYLLTPIITTPFVFEPLKTLVEPYLIVAVSLAIILTIQLMTFISCNTAVKRNAIDLLKGNVSKEHGKIRGYEKTKLWQKTSLLNKTIINNAVNDKKRCLSTIIGIAASTCMMIGSITMNANIIGAFDVELNDYFRFNYFVYFDPETDGALNNIMSYFDEKGIEAAPVYREQIFVDVNGQMQVAYAIVYSDYESFDSVITVDSSSNEEYDHSGLWLAECIKEGYSLKEGDHVSLTTSMGDQADVQIAGYYKNYNYIISTFMNKMDYQKAFGNVPKENTVFVNLRGIDSELIEQDLKQIDGFKLMFDYDTFLFSTVDVFKEIANVIVGLYFVVCVLMGFFVILNLLITFVNEKKRDLITLLINGYSFRHTSAYIYADTIFLTIIGLIVGTVSGIGLGKFVIGAFESGSMFLPHNPNLLAIGIGCGVTIVLVVLMTFISLNKVKRFKLTDINSSSM